MNVRGVFIGLIFGALVASGGTALAAAGWSWYVDVEGGASGTLGALSPLVVTDARGGDGLLPGEVLPLKVDVENPNRVPLTIVSVDVGDLESGDAACDESLADSRLRFDRTPDILVQPGENKGILLGSIRLPRLLAQACMSEDVSAPVSLRAAYGAEG